MMAEIFTLVLTVATRSRSHLSMTFPGFDKESDNISNINDFEPLFPADRNIIINHSFSSSSSNFQFERTIDGKDIMINQTQKNGVPVITIKLTENGKIYKVTKAGKNNKYIRQPQDENKQGSVLTDQQTQEIDQIIDNIKREQASAMKLEPPFPFFGGSGDFIKKQRDYFESRDQKEKALDNMIATLIKYLVSK